jgi:hypothetical protein
VIIALGESIVALGVGPRAWTSMRGSSSRALVGVAWRGACGGRTSTSSRLSPSGVLRQRSADERVRIARDSYTYLHMPMVAGIVLFALGRQEDARARRRRPRAVPAVALCGGGALYLVALSALKRRNIGSFNYPRLVAAAVARRPRTAGHGDAGAAGAGARRPRRVRPHRLRDGALRGHARPGCGTGSRLRLCREGARELRRND